MWSGSAFAPAALSLTAWAGSCGVDARPPLTILGAVGAAATVRPGCGWAGFSTPGVFVMTIEAILRELNPETVWRQLRRTAVTNMTRCDRAAVAKRAANPSRKVTEPHCAAADVTASILEATSTSGALNRFGIAVDNMQREIDRLGTA